MAKLKPNQFQLPSGQILAELPLLFQTEMVQAVLADRKTETRRLRGLQTANQNPDLWEKQYDTTLVHKEHSFIIDPANAHYGIPGDLLWVRETICYWPGEGIKYKTQASCDLHGWNQTMKEKGIRWKPSIHMPKAASRIWLMVEDISVERVQDITDEGAFREGIKAVENPPLKGEAYIDFLNLWESINGKDSWLQNPWVWVVKFRVLSKTGKPSLETIEQNYLQVTSSPSGVGGRKEPSHA